MSNTDADNLLNSDDVFEDRPVATTKSRKKKSGMAAEIVLPEPEPVVDEDADEDFEDGPADEDLGDPIDGSEDDISEWESDEAPIVAENEDESEDSDDSDDEVDDDDADDEEDRDPAVAAAVRAVQQANRQNKRIDLMANSAKSKNKTTKADAIRAAITKMKNAGAENIRPRDVIAALAKQGVEVTSPQVSVMLSKWDEQGEKKPRAEKPTKPQAKPQVKAKPTTEEPSRAMHKLSGTVEPKAAAGFSPTYAELSATGAFVKSAGGLASARMLLDAYEDLLGTAG